MRPARPQQGERISRPIYALPVPHAWNTRAGVTILTAVARYEATTLSRAAANAAGAHEGLQSAISDGAPDMDHFPQDDPGPAV